MVHIGSICFCTAWRSRSPPNRAAVAKSEVLQGPFHDWQRNCLFKHTIPSWMIIIPFAKASVTPEDIIISRGLRQCSSVPPNSSQYDICCARASHLELLQVYACSPSMRNNADAREFLKMIPRCPEKKTSIMAKAMRTLAINYANYAPK